MTDGNPKLMSVQLPRDIHRYRDRMAVEKEMNKRDFVEEVWRFYMQHHPLPDETKAPADGASTTR